MLTAPEAARWRRWFYAALLGLCASYVPYAAIQYPHGGSRVGIIYGVLGVTTILILMYFGIRKRSYKSSLGTLQAWLHSHIYLGILALPMILFHSGFRFHDKVAVTALILLLLVVVSGVIGAILYTVVPPWFMHVESNLAATEISQQINHLAQSMARLAAGKTAAFQEVSSHLIHAERPAVMAGWRILSRGGSGRQMAEEGNRLKTLLLRVGPNEETDLNQLLVLARQMSELHGRLIQKQRYVNVMAVWLYIHVPFSFAMMIAIGAHIAASLYYW